MSDCRPIPSTAMSSSGNLQSRDHPPTPIYVDANNRRATVDTTVALTWLDHRSRRQPKCPPVSIRGGRRSAARLVQERVHKKGQPPPVARQHRRPKSPTQIGAFYYFQRIDTQTALPRTCSLISEQKGLPGTRTLLPRFVPFWANPDSTNPDSS